MKKCNCGVILNIRNKTGKCRKCYKKEYEYSYCIKRYKEDKEFADKQSKRAIKYANNNLSKTRQYRNEYRKNREKTDINFKIANYLRSRLTHAVSNNQKAGSAVEDLGCSIEELKQYLESKFQEGMTWDNYGKWHIDHIKPLSKYNLENREELLEVCNYNNLQPLWSIDNLKKGNK